MLKRYSKIVTMIKMGKKAPEQMKMKNVSYYRLLDNDIKRV